MRAGARSGCAPAVALVAAACVTSYENAPLLDVTKPAIPAVAIAIPFGEVADADERLLYDFYGGVFARLQTAAEDRDHVQLEALLAAYDRPGLPQRLASVLRGYAAVALGLRWQQHVTETAELALASDAVPPVGEPVRFHLRVPPPSMPVRLGAGAGEDPSGFAVAVAIDDTFADGSTHSTHTQDFAWLPVPWTFAGGEPLTVPIEVGAARGAAVRRVVHLRIDQMPGYVTVDGERAPVERHAVGAISLVQWPAGSEAIAKDPLAALRDALRSGDPAHFAHVFVAAAFVGADEREAAIDLLIEQVRFGRPDQAQVATAALRELTGAKLTPGDRDAWLAWWQARR